MQQAIQKPSQTVPGDLTGLRSRLALLGMLAGELLALTSLVSALVAGMLGLKNLLGVG